MREKTYPYSPLRLLYMAENKPPGERYAMWLIVFLMRLGLEDHVTMVKDIKKFAKKFET